MNTKFGSDLLNCKGAFTVPTNYNHKTQVDDFVAKIRKLKITYYYNNSLTSKNFSKATNKLVAGRTYGIKMFPILQAVQSEDCIAFLKLNNAILVGAQGLTALWLDQSNIFPIGKWVLSFDEKNSLLKDTNLDHRLPYINRFSDGCWEFGMGCFKSSQDSLSVLVCFCDLDQSSDTK